jgi:hypothetical protein
MAETPPINKPSNNAYPELNRGYCGLNAAITTRTNPAIAPPIAGTKGLAPLKAIHQITIAEAIRA